jgi:DNA-binding XRE family transcriptional regulator
LRDLDAPLCGDTTARRAPLGAGVFLCAEFSGDIVDEAPSQAGIKHSQHIGQIVHHCQDTVSQEHWTQRPYSRRMAENRELEFNEALCARVHRLRNERGWTAEQMATALGVPPDRYRKYEYRSPLPHYLIEQFAIIVGRDVEFVLTGKLVRQIVRQEEDRRKRA